MAEPKNPPTGAHSGPDTKATKPIVANETNATILPECVATHAARSTASAMHSTASANSTTSAVELRRAAACRSKKFIACTDAERRQVLDDIAWPKKAPKGK